MPITTFTFIDLAGSVALLLLGTQMFQIGMYRAFGSILEPFLLGALRDRGHAFLAGLGVSAFLQSSNTTTGWMTARVAMTRPAGLVPALAAVLGANIGATLVVQMLLVFDLPALSPALILAGVSMFRKASNTRAHDLGRALIGLGLTLLALHLLLELMTDYEDAPSLRMLLGAASTMPVIDMLLAASLSWAAESNVAAVLLIASLCARNVVPPDTAFALVLGANLGTAARPVLDRGSPNDPASWPVPLGILFMQVAGAALVLFALVPIGRIMVVMEPDYGRVVADFHSLFNVALAVLLLPLLSPYASVLARLMPTLVRVEEWNAPLHEQVSTEVSRKSPYTDVLQCLPAASGDSREDRRPEPRASTAVFHVRKDVLDNLNVSGHLQAPLPNAAPAEEQQRSQDAGSTSGASKPGIRGYVRETGPNTLEYLGEDGDLLTYEPTGTIWLCLRDLQVMRQLEPAGGTERSTLSTYICGTACLDGGDLSIIGEPSISSREIRVTFSSREISVADHQGLRDLQDARGTTFSDAPLGIARLGFNRSDDEMHEPDQWWASINIPASSLGGLKSGVEAGRLAAVSLGLCLQGVYALASDFHGQPHDLHHLLRPNSADARDCPQTATGYVTHLALDFARINLSQSNEENMSSDPITADRRAKLSETETIHAIDQKLNKLFVVLKWIAVLGGALIIGFALARH